MARKRAKPDDGSRFQYTTLKVRLYPSAEQRELFEKQQGAGLRARPFAVLQR